MTVQSRWVIQTDADNRGFKSAGKAADSFEKTMKRLGTAVAAVAGAAGLGRMVKSAIDTGDRIQKLAIQTGATTESLSQLAHAANLTGTAFEPAVKSIQQMQRTAVEAAKGTASYAEAYADLGINVQRFVELQPEQQLEVMAEAMVGLESDAERSALAMELMGKQGRDMLPLLLEGAGGIRAMREEADELGLTLSQLEADQLAAANDAIARLQGAATGLAQDLAIKLAPGIVFLADVLRSAIDVIIEMASGLGALAAAVVAVFEGNFREAVGIVRAWTGDVGKALSDAGDTIGKAWARLSEGGKAAAEAMDSVGTAAERQIDPVVAATGALLEYEDATRDVATWSERAAGSVNVWAVNTSRLGDEVDAVTRKTRTLRGEAEQISRTPFASPGGQFREAIAGELAEAPSLTVPENGVGSLLGQRFFFQNGRIAANIGRGGRVTAFSPGFIPPADAIQPGGGLRFATGGVVPTTGAHVLEAGERVVSNRVTVDQININFTGAAPRDPSQMRRWVRDVFMPEFEAAMR